MNLARKASRLLERVLAGACGLVLAALLTLVTLTAFQRYALSSGFLGAEEVGVWLLVLVACLGFPLVADGPIAMRVDLFPRAGVRIGAVRAVIAEAIVLCACMGLISSGASAALQASGTSALLGLGEWMRPAALGLAGLLGIVVRLLVLVGEGAFTRLVPAFLLALAAWGAIMAGPTIELAPPSIAAFAIVSLGILVAAPLPHAFILAGFAALAFGSPLVAPAVALQLVSGIGRHLLLAIPFFLLAGGLLTVSGMGSDLVRFAAALVGCRRAGLGQTVLLTSLLFSGTSGSSIANAAFGAKTFHGPLVAAGQAPARAGALIAAVSVLDNIVPPSIAFFILAVAANLPVGPLLVGGLFAGLVLAAVLFAMVHVTAGPQAHQSPAPDEPAWQLAAAALPVFGLGLIVVAGIRFGLATPTEAAALAAAYTLATCLARGAGADEIAAGFARAATEAAAILALIGAAAPLAFLLATDGATALATGLVATFGANPFLIMIAANLLLLAIGLVLDIGAAILLFSPILVPLAVGAGIDPVHFGVLLIVNLMIGGLTPPVGILVQVVGAATGVPAMRLFRALLPYLAGLIAALLAMSLCVAAIAHIP